MPTAPKKKQRKEQPLYTPPKSRLAQNQKQNVPSTSTPEETKVELTEEETRAAKVYLNDLIMFEIVSNLTTLKDRCILETCSKRLNEISKKARYNLTRIERIIKFLFYDFGPNITIQMGEKGGFSSVVPCLTMDTRQMIVDRNDISTRTQPSALIHYMTKVFERVSPYIDEVVIGGPGEEFSFIEDHMLVITKDFLIALNGLKCLKSLKFSCCTFDVHALNFLATSELSFHKTVTKLSLDRVCIERRDDEHKLANFVTSKLEEIECIGVKLETLGVELVRRIKEHRIHLKKVTLTINTVNDVIVAREQLTSLYRSTDNMDLRFCSSSRDFGFLLHLARSVKTMPELRCLTVNVNCHSMRDNVDFGELFEDLKQQQKLEVLKLGGFDNDILYEALNRGLLGCNKLKVFQLNNKAQCRNTDEILRLVKHLPDTLMELDFDGLPVNNDMIDILAEKYGRTLKKLSINNAKKGFTLQSYIKVTQSFKKVESFAISLPIPPRASDHILDMKKLNEATLILENGCPLFVETVLKDNFESFTKIQVVSPRNGIYVKLQGRKPTGMLRIPKEKKFMEERKPAPVKKPAKLQWN